MVKPLLHRRLHVEITEDLILVGTNKKPALATGCLIRRQTQKCEAISHEEAKKTKITLDLC